MQPVAPNLHVDLINLTQMVLSSCSSRTELGSLHIELYCDYSNLMPGGVTLVFCHGGHSCIQFIAIRNAAKTVSLVVLLFRDDLSDLEVGGF
jgi:hypothetical protein